MHLPHTSEWHMEYTGWDPEQQRHREALCTLGNGRFATRGAFAGAKADEVHYPGTYLNGGYNRRISTVAGRQIENEDLVNLPNWLCLNFRPESGDWLEFNQVEWLEYRQNLDVRHGILTYHLHFRDDARRETRLTARRIVHMNDKHLAALEWSLQPVNWSEPIVIRSAIDGQVENLGVVRYRKLETRHLEPLETSQQSPDMLLLRSTTNQSRLDLAQTIRTRILQRNLRQADESRQLIQETGYIGQDIYVEVAAGEAINIEKISALYTGSDRAISEPGLEACTALSRASGFSELLTSHKKAWDTYWTSSDIQLDMEESDHEQLILRLHIFHLLQTTSLHTVDMDVGVPARGLHGEAYRGHIFWDELFIFPALNMHFPQVTRALLMYRYRRLPEARWAARKEGFNGAMFPWQSGSNGREESQTVHLNPKSGRWLPDHTYKQRHINAAIVHNVWRYYQTTGDTEFMAFAGAEIILSIAQFWVSAATYSEEKQRYEIRGVAGPDEFHTSYPGSREPGLNNNAYTNVMASWCLQIAGNIVDILCPTRKKNLLRELEIDQTEIERWREVSGKMFIPFHGHGIISQFEGYEKLKELDWRDLQEKHGDIQRLDRVLELEGDDINRYKASKQADVLMLFYLFSTEQINKLFQFMGYTFSPDMIPRNIEYYHKRTSHGSTLSNLVHSWVEARSDRQRSWDLFGNVLVSDLADVQGGTTCEGIHLGAMAGTVDMVLRCYSGLELRNDVLWLNPMLPNELRQVKLKIHYRGHWVSIRVDHQKLSVSTDPGPCPPIKVGFQGQIYNLEQGEVREFHNPPFFG